MAKMLIRASSVQVMHGNTENTAKLHFVTIGFTWKTRQSYQKSVFGVMPTQSLLGSGEKEPGTVVTQKKTLVLENIKQSVMASMAIQKAMFFMHHPAAIITARTVQRISALGKKQYRAGIGLVGIVGHKPQKRITQIIIFRKWRK